MGHICRITYGPQAMGLESVSFTKKKPGFWSKPMGLYDSSSSNLLSKKPNNCTNICHHQVQWSYCPVAPYACQNNLDVTTSR